jgi:peptidyl-prolyl cis-trans isomerase B (cyclophilin B)
LASKSNRQRRLERARAERRVARRAEQLRRRRQLQAGIGAGVALVLIVLGTIYLLGGFSPKPRQTVASGSCTWTLLDAASDNTLVDTGHPPTTGEPRSGFSTLTIKTNKGDIEARMDLGKTPCTAASWRYLAGRNYYQKATCFQLDTNQKTLSCGDPKNDGAGEPSYQYASELVPTAPLGESGSPAPTIAPSSSSAPSASPTPPPANSTYYVKGTILMINNGAGTNGGQFMIVYDDKSPLSNSYTVVGTVTKGLDLVQAIATGGATDTSGSSAPAGAPNQPLIMQSVSVADVPTTPSISPTTTPSTS